MSLRIAAYAPKDSFRFYVRRRRLARLRGALLRPEVAGLALALFLAVTLGASNGFEAVRVLGGWLVGR